MAQLARRKKTWKLRRNVSIRVSSRSEAAALGRGEQGGVTQASAAIPVVPLYLSLLAPALKSRDLDEGPIEQMHRLFRDYFAGGSITSIDQAGANPPRWSRDAQRCPGGRQPPWPRVTTENLREITGFADFQRDFRRLFGFEVDGVDYDAPVETDLRW